MLEDVDVYVAEGKYGADRKQEDGSGEDGGETGQSHYEIEVDSQSNGEIYDKRHHLLHFTSQLLYGCNRREQRR